MVCIVRTVSLENAATLASIYNHYVLGTVVTFEEEPVGVAEMSRRIGEVLGAGLPWLVAEVAVVGYAYATRWRVRAAYRFSVETTVYLQDGLSGRGVGSALYGELFAQLRSRGAHAVIGGIALPNAGSVALHEKFGMRKVAEFAEVGFKLGRWVDVGYWEVVL